MSSVPPPHERILQHVGLTEQGLRELEIWLLGRLGAGRGGLQYHKARHYGAHNVGDWLFVETTSDFAIDPQNARFQGSRPAMLLKAESHNAAGSGIVLWSHDDVVAQDPVWQLYPEGIVYFLDGQMDLGYTEGGNILRYSGGGGITFYTTEGNLPNSGDFQVSTSGTVDDSAITTGSITLDASNTANGAGNVALYAFGGTPGYIRLSTADGVALPPNQGEIVASLAVSALFRVTDHTKSADLFSVAEDSTTVHNLAAGKTHVINDHLGSPLVTYTG